MSLETYRIMHFVGLILLFMGLGGAVFQRSDGKAPGLALMLHGLGWVAVIVAGFGILARRPDLGWDGWLISKLVILVLLGVLPILVRKKIIPPKLGWLVAALCGGVAVWLVTAKPF